MLNQGQINSRSDQLDIDILLDTLGLFSTRVTNALMRQGIITPRLLLMHTLDFLSRNTKNLGPKGMIEIENKLEQRSWQLAESIDEEQTTLICMIAIVLYQSKHPLSLLTLKQKINNYYHNTTKRNDADIANALAFHPYVEIIGVSIDDNDKAESDLYQFCLHSTSTPNYALAETQIDSQISSAPVARTLPDPEKKVMTEDGTILLSELWPAWISTLNERYQEVFFLYYGIRAGETALTMKEVGIRMGMTRSRVQQIDKRGRRLLGSSNQQSYWEPLLQLLTEKIQKAGGLLIPNEWERLFDEKIIWKEEYPRPTILKFLCAIFDEFHYVDSYQVATFGNISKKRLVQLESVIKRILRQHKKTGLSSENLIKEVQLQLHPDVPSVIREYAFILSALKLFEWIETGKNGYYFYKIKKRETRYPVASSDWVGQPGSRLNKWEVKLREQFEKIAWIGQLSFSDDDFKVLCQIIQEDAQGENIQTKRIEGQPPLVPPAVFLTAMVFSARYAVQEPDEAIDEFWDPYMRSVWGIQNSQAFYVRCKKRFNAITPFLEDKYGFEFPYSGTSQRSVVTPIFRHALIPRYMQNDFATWLRKNWRNILTIADTPALLISQLQEDRTLDHYYSHRLKQFIRGKATAETASALISNMAAAISLHVNDGETVESINDMLSDTPIEQELWREIAQEFAQQEGSVSSLRLAKSRLNWIWSLDEGELVLRVQNIILSAKNKLEGELDRLVWMNKEKTDSQTTIDMEVTPWRMKTGERIINDVIFQEPDGPLNGQIVLLTDLDEEAIRLDVPPHPVAEVQFFRITQQGAYGIPVNNIQVDDGTWLVCAKQPLTFLDENNEIIEPDMEHSVPYPLEKTYNWAAQLTLSLPVAVSLGTNKLVDLAQASTQTVIGLPSLIGERPVAGLSHQIQPTFSDTQLVLIIEHGGERLLRQASLWVRGQDGWRYQRSLAELRQQGMVKPSGPGLSLDLGRILPMRPNYYTVELRISLQPVFSAPLQFAIVPDLEVVSLPDDRLHTPANPPQIILQGIVASTIVRAKGLLVDSMTDNCQKITWTDLRQNPHLVLRFDMVDIPLIWIASRFTVWLEPKQTKPFLTLEEVRQTTLHAVGTHSSIESFTLSVLGQRGRFIKLDRGRYTANIGQSQLYDMVRQAQGQHTIIKVQAGSDIWTLFEVRKRPQLLLARVEYNEQERIISFNTGMSKSWAGKGRFVAESLTNPYMPTIELGQITQLRGLHSLPSSLRDGVYLFRLELDGAWLPLDKDKMRFTIGKVSNDIVHSPKLIKEIREGQLISPNLAEDFILWWADIAETEETKLTPSTLYQLATTPAEALVNFDFAHLEKLWAPLTAHKEVYNKSGWAEKYGLLPAWILLRFPIILKTARHGYGLRVYPILAAQGGLVGVGYGRWRMSFTAHKELIYVQWSIESNTQVHVEAGLPEKTPSDWTFIDLLDTYGLYHCSYCGRLTGTSAFTIPAEIEKAHLHNHQKADLRGITFPEEAGGYRLIADFYLDHRGILLQDIYEKHKIAYPDTKSYFPEPPMPKRNFLTHEKKHTQILMLVREIKRRGSDAGALPFWANADRLLVAWSNNEEVSQLGQAVFSLGVLLRTAANNRTQYRKLLKDASLSELDVQNLLAEIDKTAPAHLQWGLTWAELLYQHSPHK